jgi:hypothetical protein
MILKVILELRMDEAGKIKIISGSVHHFRTCLVAANGIGRRPVRFSHLPFAGKCERPVYKVFVHPSQPFERQLRPFAGGVLQVDEPSAASAVSVTNLKHGVFDPFS